jgi:hypothetical protein
MDGKQELSGLWLHGVQLGSVAPLHGSLDEMKQKYQSQRDKEFAPQLCQAPKNHEARD